MFDAENIRSVIERVVSELEPQAAWDVAFHMTDWLNNLEDLINFYQNPLSFSTKEAGQLLMSFLVHVPNHIAAAAKLYADSPVQDIFGVGAVKAP